MECDPPPKLEEGWRGRGREEVKSFIKKSVGGGSENVDFGGGFCYGGQFFQKGEFWGKIMVMISYFGSNLQYFLE